MSLCELCMLAFQEVDCPVTNEFFFIAAFTNYTFLIMARHFVGGGVN